MTVFEIEELRQKVLNFLSESKSCRQRLFFIKDFYSAVLGSKNNSIIDSYIAEFISEYLECVERFEVFCFPPDITYEIINQLNVLKEIASAESYTLRIEKLVSSLSSKLTILYKILNGEEGIEERNNKLLFPLVESSAGINNQIPIGALETFTIDISRSKDKDEFIVVPSYESSAQSLFEQVHISWDIAYNFVKQHYAKIGRFHKIVINFDHRYGNYTGFSLGAALTLEFIQGIISLYNFPFSISIKNGITITGGFENNKSFLSIGKETIENKVSMVFYSTAKSFVVPEESKQWAVEKLNELKKNYPNRNLEIIGVSTLQDLLNRRNLVDIKEQNAAVRGLKIVKQNLPLSASLLILVIVIIYFYLFNFDNNPALLYVHGNNLFVENSSGKVLWSKGIEIDPQFASSTLRYNAKIVDVNNDKKNEVVLSGVILPDLKNKKEYGGIFCYNYLGKQLWHYDFKDTVKSYGENLEPVYSCGLIDTATYQGEKLLVAKATNGPSFSSAIFTLDLKSGKRVGTAFWNSGHINEGIIQRMPDHKDLIIFVGSNNGYERAFIGGVELNKLAGYSPSTPYYTFLNMKPADLNFYILIPETDYLKHFTVFRGGCIEPGSLHDSEKERKIHFVTCEKQYYESSLDYRLDYNFKDMSIVVDSNFRLERDTAVAHGILQPPFTDTPQYCKLLEDQILYWNGKNFVHKNDLN